MSFLWLQSSGNGNPGLAEYARAYERAVTSGSIDSAISWELGGLLMKNPKYQSLMLRIISAVTALRASRDTAGFAPPMRTSENRV